MGGLSPEVAHRENALHLIGVLPAFSRIAQALKLEQVDNTEEAGQGAPVAREKAVRFITLHSSKGLDGDFVFIPFLEEALGLPAGDEEERRRLLYVALTRAKVGIAISWAWSRRSEKRFKCSGDGGDVTKRSPSPSIEESGVSPSLVPPWQGASSAAAAIDMLCRHAEAIHS